MLRSATLFFAAALWTLSSNAEVFKANFQAPDNKGRPKTYGIEVELTQSGGEAISGVIKTIYGVAACRWEGVPVSGSLSADGNVRWSSEENPMKGCGRIVFVGKKEGNNWVGNLPRFQGVKVDLTLEPAK